MGLKPVLTNLLRHYLSGADLIFSLALWVPDCGCILWDQSNKGLVCSFLCLHASDFQVVPQEAKCLIMLVGGIGAGNFSHPKHCHE